MPWNKLKTLLHPYISCLQAFQYMKLDWDGDTKVFLFVLNVANKDIMFCCVLSHVGIRRNEKADSAAKSALNLPHV